MSEISAGPLGFAQSPGPGVAAITKRGRDFFQILQEREFLSERQSSGLRERLEIVLPPCGPLLR